jgi:hypothetical protein
MERRLYVFAFGSKPQWAEVAEMADELEKVDMMEKADTAEMAEKADAAVERADAVETLASQLEAQCIPLAIERWYSWLLPAHTNPLHPQGSQASAAQMRS